MHPTLAFARVCSLLAPAMSIASQAPVPAPAVPPAPAPAAERSASDAIRDGLAWLIAHQDESGAWSASLFVRHDPKNELCTGTGKPDQDFHVTVWATMAMLATGSTMQVGPHRERVQKAVDWIRAQQQRDGFVGAREAANSVASHALSCLALAEASGLSDAAQPKEALARLVALRLPDGTWPARPGQIAGDAEASYWAGLACASGCEFGGAKVDLEPLLAAFAGGKLAGSMPGGAEAFLRAISGHPPDRDARFGELLDGILAQTPSWGDAPQARAGVDFLAWYLGTYAAYQMGGDPWQRWHAALERTLLAHQRTDGAHAGSWDPIDARGKDGGRVYATAINVMSLAAGHRYARVVRK